MVTIDSERCTGCGACVEVCPADAIRLIRGEVGNYAEISKEKCRQCEACVEACLEKAIMSEIEPVIEGEIVQVKAKPVPVKPQSRQVRPVRPVPKALMWLGPALAFVGREIVPRVAAALLDVWDRRSGRPASSLNDLTSGRSAQRSMTNLPRGGRRRRRRGG